jgi:hypothetical protein
LAEYVELEVLLRNGFDVVVGRRLDVVFVFVLVVVLLAMLVGPELDALVVLLTNLMPPDVVITIEELVDIEVLLTLTNLLVEVALPLQEVELAFRYVDVLFVKTPLDKPDDAPLIDDDKLLDEVMLPVPKADRLADGDVVILTLLLDGLVLPAEADCELVLFRMLADELLLAAKRVEVPLIGPDCNAELLDPERVEEPLMVPEREEELLAIERVDVPLKGPEIEEELLELKRVEVPLTGPERVLLLLLPLIGGGPELLDGPKLVDVE